MNHDLHEYLKYRLGCDPGEINLRSVANGEQDPLETAAGDTIVDRLLVARAHPPEDELILRRVMQGVRTIEKSRRRDSFKERTIFDLPMRRLVAVIAASVVVCSGLWWMAGHLLPSPVASLEAFGDVWVIRGRRAISVNSPTRLYQGDTIFTGERSRAVIRYRNHRSCLTLRSDGRIRILHAAKNNLARLESGTITAAISRPAGSNGLILETPHARIVAASAQLRARVESDETFLDVFEGKAELARLSGNPKPIDVAAGEKIAVNTRPLSVPVSQDPPVIAQVTTLEPGDLDKVLRLGRAFGINTLAYDLTVEATSPPDELRDAVAEAHKQGFLFYARVDLQAMKAADLREPARWIREHLAPIVTDFDLDGVYFHNGGDLSRDKGVASMLMPLYDAISESLPGTSMLVGYSSPSSI